MIDKRHFAGALGVLVLLAVGGLYVGARSILSPMPVPARLREPCPRDWEALRAPANDVTIALCARKASDKTGPLVFVLHGGGDGKASFYPLGEKLFRAGFSVALVDARAHGESTGEVLSYGVFESTDLPRVRTFLETRGYPVDRVGVLGFSYGAATAIMWAAVDPHVTAIVAVAPYASLRRAAPVYARMMPAGNFIPDAFTDLAVSLAGRLGHFDPDDSPYARAKNVTAPTLLVHGEKDVHVPPGHSQVLKPRFASSELVIVPGMSHEDMFEHPRVFDAATAWFSERINPAPPEKTPAPPATGPTKAR